MALVGAMPALGQDASGQAPPAPEQQGPGDTLSDEDVDAIVVTAARVRGQVQTASAPVLELSQEDVQAYGADSLADLVSQLAPQVGSGSGRGGQPVFLLNGQRISNFHEIGRFPPEAVKKVEVLPEEVALKFGFRPDQRVINFILQDNFVSREVELEYGAPTRGGYGAGEAELGLLRIDGSQRLSASLGFQRATPLTEAERGIIQTPGTIPTDPTDPNPADFRTLTARSEQLEANVTGAVGLGEGGSGGQLTLNSRWVSNRTVALSGLDLLTTTDASGNPVIRTIDANPLERLTNTDTLSIGAGYNRRIGDYQFTTTLDAGLIDAETLIDRRRTAPGPVVTDRAQSQVWTAGLKSTLIGNPVVLPAGEMGVTLTGAYDWSRIERVDTRTVSGAPALTRGDLSAAANISVPITSRRENVLGALGDVTLNLSGGVNSLSDFGSLGSFTAGVVWRPTGRLTLQATQTVRETAPGLSQLGAPTIVSFNLPVYDFRSGQSVLVTQTSGGNPSLRAETQRDLKLSASYDLDLLERANILVEYYRNRSDDVTSAFPLLTPAIEAAFPGRVTRDQATGRLTALDARPVTFSQTRSQRLRYGFNLFGKLGKPFPPGERPPGGGGAGPFAAAGRATAPAPAPAHTAPGPSGEGRPAAGMDPQRLAEMRTKFCATPPGTIPDLSGLPQGIQDRLKGEDGKTDPARVALMRERLCSADAARRFDPARFAAMRQALCADTTKEPDPEALPEEVRNRLKGPDGAIAPARLREFRDRICALPASQGTATRTAGEGGSRGTPAPAASGPQHGGGGPRVGFGPGGGDGQGRWSLGIYHTVNLENLVLIAPGVPVLDLLDGAATGSGGVPRNQLEFEGGAFYRGLGVRLSGTYSAATVVSGTGLPGSSDLFFGDLAKFNLRAFVALDQQAWLVGAKPGFFKQARLALSVSNLFDTRQRITDGNGVVPLRYQPFLLDPVGRFVEVEFRKLF